MNIFIRVSKSFNTTDLSANAQTSINKIILILDQVLVYFTQNKDWNRLILFRLVILIGDVSVGKTCLLSRYLKNQLPKSAGPTIGVEFATKNVIMKDGATVKA